MPKSLLQSSSDEEAETLNSTRIIQLFFVALNLVKKHVEKSVASNLITANFDPPFLVINRQLVVYFTVGLD